MKDAETGRNHWSLNVQKSVVIPDHELLRCIGKGSYGEVWLAKNIVGTYRAVKIVYRDNFSDARPYEREFTGIQKFEPLSRSNEGLVDILQIGRNDHVGYFYYVMELADDVTSAAVVNPSTYVAKTLSSEVKRNIRIPFEQCLDLGLALSLTLGHLHRHGLIHRDIKPSNIIFVNGVPKLADIGLVTDLGGAQSFVGTEGFIPPEGPNSAQADIYSLGKVIYEISMGKDRQEFPEPFTMLRDTPESAALLELNAVILKACAPDSKQRYASADDLHLDLALLQSGKSVKRKYALERRLKLAVRLGTMMALLAVLGALAFGIQRARTSEARRLAQKNNALAVERQRLLVRMQVDNGTRLVQEGDYADALLWFAAAFNNLPSVDHEREKHHLIRIDSVARQLPRIIRVFQHQGGVNWCEFDRAGERLLTAGRNGIARVYDVQSGRQLTPDFQHSDFVYLARFSPDEKLVLTASKDTSAALWDAQSGLRLHTLQHSGSVVHASFSADGSRVLTASTDKNAMIWDATTGAVLSTMSHDRGVTAACFSPDGKMVLTASGRRIVRLWEAGTGQKLAEWPFETQISVLTFSPDGKIALIAGGLEGRDFIGRAQLWNIQSRARVGPPLRLVSAVKTGAFSTDGHRFVVGGVGFSQVFATATQIVRGKPIPDSSGVRAANFSSDGSRVVVCSENGSARVWCSDTGESLSPQLKHAGWVLDGRFSPDGHLLATASDDGLVRLWDLTVDSSEALMRHDTAVLDVGFSSRYSRIFTGEVGDIPGGSLRIWEYGNVTTPLRRDMFSSSPSQIVVSPDGQFLSVASPIGIVNTNHFVRVLNASNGAPVYLQGAIAQIRCTGFSRDSAKLFVGMADGTVRILNVLNGNSIGADLHHSSAVLSADFSADGSRLVTSTANHTAHVWRLSTGEQIFPPLLHDDGAVAVAKYSPDGSRIVTGGQDQMVRIWNAQTGEPVSRPVKQGGVVWSVNFAPDGTRIATASRAPRLNIWHGSSAERLVPPMIHENAIRYCEFSSDGSLVVTASYDNTARLWDAQTGELLIVPWRHDGPVNKAMFIPQSNVVLTASDDKTARVWTFQPASVDRAGAAYLAKLYASYGVDNTLSRSRLTAEHIFEAHSALQQQHSPYVSRRTNNFAAWHAEQAHKARTKLQWSLAKWHLDVLIQETGAVDFYRHRGDCFAELGWAWTNAAADFEKAILLGDDSSGAQGRLLIALRLAGSDNACEQLFAKMVREAETLTGAALESAVLQLSSIESPISFQSKLLRLARRMAAEQPSNTDRWANAGLACYRAGKFEEALGCFSEMRKRGMPSGISPLYVESICLLKVGRSTDALQAYRIATELDDDAHFINTAAKNSVSWPSRVRGAAFRKEAKELFNSLADSI